MITIKELLLYLIFIVLVTESCSKERQDEAHKLVGAWQLISRMVDGQIETLSGCEEQNLMFFEQNQICYLFDSCAVSDIKSGWSFQSGMLNIEKLLPQAYYIIGMDNNLELKCYNYDNSGNLKQNILTYKKVDVLLKSNKIRITE